MCNDVHVSYNSKMLRPINVYFEKKPNGNWNKRNDKRFSNHNYSLFFLMGIFLKHLFDCKMIFTKLAPSQAPSRSSHQRYSVKKGVLKNSRNFEGKRLCWSLFLIIKLEVQACNFIKKRVQHRCFPKFHKFLRTPF